ncbi:MAG: hypothetical protein PHN19_03120 [Patescibacteria group bacterium]|nr:hypothetical protein [Patescibacteria group bacterium]
MIEGEPQLSESEIKDNNSKRKLTKEEAKLTPEQLFSEVSGLLQASEEKLKEINKSSKGITERMKELESISEKCFRLFREEEFDGEHFEIVSLKRDLEALRTQKEAIFELERQANKFADHLAKLIYDIEKKGTN